MIKILFLAANPSDTSRLRLDEEVRAIEEALRESEFRNRFELHSHWAVRIDDLQKLLLRYKPDIVHFSGHGIGTLSARQNELIPAKLPSVERPSVWGPADSKDTYSPTSQIVLQDAGGQSVPVPPKALSNLFQVLKKDNIRCVVLNACYTQAQAEGIAQHVDCVIGMSNVILEVTAITFVAAFYRGLGYGRSVQVAFDLGCSQIDLSALPGRAIPQLMAPRTDANHITLAEDSVPAEPDTDTEPAPGDPPYMGLHYFDTPEAELFFGREVLVAELCDLLRQQRFLAVVGASGSGKSSVVRAGLVPALQGGDPLVNGTLSPEGSSHWPVHIITPTAYPLKELAASLMRNGGSHLEQVRLEDEFVEDARILDRCVSRMLSGGPSERLLLVVDQFEELFTQCRDRTKRQAFVDNLLTAAVPDGMTMVVITLRADFYAHCSQFDDLRQALERQQKYIGPMNRKELRQAIEKPAQQGGWDFEPGIVDLLLHDVGDEPGALPLLSHALLETWNRRRGRTLTLAGYVESGRVQGAIALTAERVLNQELTSEQRAIAKNIFLRLTELGEDSEDTRRRVSLQELLPKPEEKPVTERVLQTLADARLVITGKNEVEVAHEALIREWPTLQRWLDENREGLRIHRRLGEAANEWDGLNRDPSVLYSGVRLAQALEWESNNDVVLSDLERSFLQASRDRAVRLQRIRQGAVATVAALVLIVIAGLSWQQVNQRQNEREFERLRVAAVQHKDQLEPKQAIASLEAANALYPDRFDLDLEVEGVRRHIATERLAQAEASKEALKPKEALASLEAANALYPDLFDFEAEADEVRRYVATIWTQEGEQLARTGVYDGAGAKFAEALELDPPPDTPVYVWIKPGEFIMGSNEEDNLADPDEMPQHIVYLDGFWIRRTEVTNAQYSLCVNAGICEPPNNGRYENPDLANHPVTNMGWVDAQTYTEWVGGRLPTEAEWEKACRGTGGQIYPLGNNLPNHELLNFDYNVAKTTAVGSYPPGNYGLYDMAGNVWEWTANWYSESYYKNSPKHNPIGPEDGNRRTLRGGSWQLSDTNMRCANRCRGGCDGYGTSVNYGIRVVIDPSPTLTSTDMPTLTITSTKAPESVQQPPSLYFNHTGLSEPYKGSIYSLRNGQTTLVHTRSQPNPNWTIYAVAMSNSGQLYFLDSNGFHLYRLENESEKVIYTHDTYVRDIVVDSQERIYFSEATGASGDGIIYQLDGSQPVVFYRVLLSQVDGFWSGNFSFDNQGNLWLSSGNSIPAYLYKVVNERPQRRFTTSEGSFDGFFFDANGDIIYVNGGNTIYHLTIPEYQPTGIFTSTVDDILDIYPLSPSMLPPGPTLNGDE